MKKLLLTFLSSFFLMTASAEVVQGTCDGVNWTYDKDTYVLTISVAEGNVDGKMADHTKADTEWHKYILATYGNTKKPVYVYISDYVEKVVIEEGITHIGNYSFSNCECLVEVVLPKTVKTIGAHAFDNSTELVTISGIASNVTSVGVNAFNSTQVMNNGYLQLGNTLFTATEATGDLDFTGKGITHIADKAFQNNESITSVTFDNDLEVIGKSAFAGCTNLNGMVIPNSVKTIGQYAFQDCTKLPVVGDYRMAGDYIIVEVADQGKAEYTIGNDIIYVAEYAFSFAGATVTINCNQTEAPLAGANAFTMAPSYEVPDGSEASYETNWGLSGAKINTTSFVMGKTGYATIALRHSATVPEGLKAYRATIDSDLNVALTEVKGKLAAEAGYVLVGDANKTYEFAPAREVVEDNEPNHMVGVIEDTFLEGEHIYMLSLFNGKVGFRSLKDATYTLTAGKAYLDASLSSNSASSVEFMNFSFGGNTTDIDAVTATQSKARTGIYNVSGQQLSAPRKGMNIVNGKVIYF